MSVMDESCLISLYETWDFGHDLTWYSLYVPPLYTEGNIEVIIMICIYIHIYIHICIHICIHSVYTKTSHVSCWFGAHLCHSRCIYIYVYIYILRAKFARVCAF